MEETTSLKSIEADLFFQWLKIQITKRTVFVGADSAAVRAEGCHMPERYVLANQERWLRMHSTDVRLH